MPPQPLHTAGFAACHVPCPGQHAPGSPRILLLVTISNCVELAILLSTGREENDDAANPAQVATGSP